MRGRTAVGGAWSLTFHSYSVIFQELEFINFERTFIYPAPLHDNEYACECSVTMKLVFSAKMVPLVFHRCSKKTYLALMQFKIAVAI